MVKGWSKSASWGFPKGKIGKDEDPVDCAIREVFEETGFDIGSRLDPINFIEATTSGSAGQATRLFIIPGVPESTSFITQTRKEISKIGWHRVDALPTKFGQDNRFYNIVHFVKKLHNWVQSHNNASANKNKKTKTKTNPKQNKKLTPANHNNTKNKVNNNDIFDKINQAMAAKRNNSILMRDNPSPVHLFKKLSLQEEVQFQPKTLEDHLLAFCEGLKRIRIKKSVIRAAVSSVIN